LGIEWARWRLPADKPRTLQWDGPVFKSAVDFIDPELVRKGGAYRDDFVLFLSGTDTLHLYEIGTGRRKCVKTLPPAGSSDEETLEESRPHECKQSSIDPRY